MVSSSIQGIMEILVIASLQHCLKRPDMMGLKVMILLDEGAV